MSTPPESFAPPRWARAVDLLCLLLLLLVILAEWGGIRFRAGAARISLTSPARLLAAAVVLALIRHFFVPVPPVYRDFPVRLRAAWRMPESRTAWLALIATRLTMIFVGWFAVVTLGFNTGRAPVRYLDNELLNLQARWDTFWYLTVAVDGYRYRPPPRRETPPPQQNIVFFPVLPIVLRVARGIAAGGAAGFLIRATLLVLAAFCGAAIYVYRLARDLLGDDDRARWTIWFLAAYPFAVFYGALYTESLFLLGAAGAFYHFRRRELLSAAAWGFVVGLTRPNGCFLSIPLALIAIAPWLPSWIVGGRAANGTAGGESRRLSRVVAPLAAAAAPGIAVLVYSAFVWRLTGNPLAWAEGHAAWGRQYSGLLPLAERYYTYVSESGLYVVATTLPYDVLNAFGALFAVAAAVPVWRRFGLPFAVFILINILPPLAAGGFMSAGRFSAVLFPAFVWFAAVVPERHRTPWLAAFMGIQALNAVLFYTWHEMF